jgi:hypothetical protein
MKTNNEMALATKLSKKQMRKLVGGLCNPGPYYNRPCTNNLQCGGPSCAGTLYCYIPKGSASGTCLFV